MKVSLFRKNKKGKKRRKKCVCRRRQYNRKNYSSVYLAKKTHRNSDFFTAQSINLMSGRDIQSAFPIARSFEEKAAFFGGLVLLFLAGCAVMVMNGITKAQKSELSSTLTSGLWGFEPAEDVDESLKTKSWAFRKLIAAGFVPYT